ncbi:WGR domain-containing protein, partial [Leptospira interrogans]
MNHQLTFKDDKSDKFWNIEVSGNSFTVTYGKTGTSGTS